MNVFCTARFRILKFFCRITMSQGSDKVFYAVGCGRKRGIYMTWRDCKAQIDGFTNPKFRKFNTYEKAEEFVNFWKNNTKEKVDLLNSRVSKTWDKRDVSVKNNNRHEGINQTQHSRSRPHSEKRVHNGVTKISNYILGEVPKNGLDSNLDSPKVFSVSYLSPINNSVNNKSKYFPQSNCSLVKEEKDLKNDDAEGILPQKNTTLDIDISEIKVEKPDESSAKTPNSVSSSLLKGEDLKSGQNENSNNEVVSEKAASERLSLFSENPPNARHSQMSSVRNDIGVGNGISLEDINISQENFSEKRNICENNSEQNSDNIKKCLDMLHSAMMLLSKNILNNSEPSLNPLRHFLKNLIGVTNSCVNPQMNAVDHGSSQSGTSFNGLKPVEMKSNMDSSEKPQDQQSVCMNTSSVSPSSLFLLSSPNESKQDLKNFELVALNLRLDSFEKRFDVCLKEVGGILSEINHIKDEIKDIKNQIKVATEVCAKTDVLKSATSSHCGGESSDAQLKQFVTPSCYSMDTSVSDSDNNSVKTLKRKLENTDFDNNESIDYAKVKKEKVHLASFMVSSDGYVLVYTDGACVGNGTKEAKAGFGIWFGDDHPMNTSERVKGPQTNNTAEIQAARVAIQLAIEANLKKLKICTDSEFLINCATKWIRKWKRNGWSVSDGKEVKNRKELEQLDFYASQIKVQWVKVLAHKGIKGNEEADRLAREGANKSSG